MTGPKFVFGSFTADETRSLLQKGPLGNAENPVAKTDLKFRSSDFGNGITFGNFSREVKQLLGPANGEITSTTANLVKEEKESNATEEARHSPRANGSLEQNEAKQLLVPANRSVPSSPADMGKDETNLKITKEAGHSPQANGNLEKSGSITRSSSSSPRGNGFNDVKIEDSSFQSLSFSETEEDLQNHSQSSNFHILGNGSMEKLQDGTSAKEDVRGATYDPSNLVKNLLPRGLVNSGNLCFLNASLQALLSCSPFVQLLRHLRIREVPKVGFPTLTAFTEFISNFDMPASSACKKDMAVIETGRAFVPAMFEVVLKKFTPDAPSGISGRPRQEDAQEFLSFIMNQVHDELLKLGGQSSSMNAAKSSIISSLEEDEWETVGPKNKTAVTRTQTFVPSELSDIFGGQIRSVVKARGNKASATVQPFLLLHLEIHPDVVRTVEDALHLYCVPENLEGCRSSATGKNMQRNVMTKTDASSLSQDLVDEIFLRASPTSLAKFKVLSKYYNSMISSPKFITTNLQLQTSKSLILTSSKDLRSMSLTILGSPDDLLEHIDLDNLEIAFDGGPLVGSANGLVCMRERSNDFVVLNPATKQYKRIPYRSRKFVPYNVGFGYHEDFKLVVIPKRLERMPVQVFSLTKGTWRKVRFQVERSNNRGLSLDRYAPASISVKSAPKVINGVWYRILAEDEQFVLLSFDLKDEYPAWTRIDANISYTSYLELGHYNFKNLCLYAIDRWFQSKEGSNQFDMWVMELGGLWTKMFTTNLIAPPIRSSLRTCYRLRGTWRGSPAILRYDYFGSDRSICVFSPFTHCWRRVDGEFPNCCVLDACEYYGSLLPLSTSALGQELQVNS